MKRVLIVMSVTILALAGCDEFGPSQKTYTRAVRGIDEGNSAAHEYDGNAAGVPLLTAEFPANKDDTFHIHTLADNVRATTQPARPAAALPDEPLTPITPGHSTVNLTPTGTRPASQ